MLVKKQRFETNAFALECGTRLPHVQIGFEAYGALNAASDNAILITHYFSGSSHAAGRYRETDPEPGYWDELIGPGKAFDTDRYFVLSCDSLCNLGAKNPDVITTGPLSQNPASGTLYGADFPIVTIGDFVELQHMVCRHLGIRKLQAVAGPSMGSMQAMEWTVRYPEFVARAICVVPTSLETPPYLVGMVSCWAAPILVDAKFNGGRYTPDAEPREGLIQALKLVTLTALHHDGVRLTYGRASADATKSPLASLENRYAADFEIEKIARERSGFADANSLLRLVRTVQLFSVKERIARARAAFLFLPASSDLMMPVMYAQAAVAELKAIGLRAEYDEIPGVGGHLDGLYHAGRAGARIRAFLES